MIKILGQYDRLDARRGPIELKSSRFLFPAGELGIKLDVENLNFKHSVKRIALVARIQDSNDFMALALTKNALDNWMNYPEMDLYLFYVPYARQDRVCVTGEPFSLRVLANLINIIGFARIYIADPHSDVCGGLFVGVRVIKQIDIIEKFEEFTKRVLKGVTFVAPDAGSNKKAAEIAAYFGHQEFIRADKLRDLSNGKILETIVYTDDLKGGDVVIADDLCDGGRTFTELAKALKKKNAGKIILYVTHGIFSKGTKVLFENGIDEIYSTNSYFDTLPAGVDNVTYLDLEKYFIK